MDRFLLPSVALLLGVFGLFECTGTDLWIQDRFYDFGRHAWLVDAKAALPRLVFYTGPKTIIWIIGLGLLALTAMPPGMRSRLPLSGLSRRDLAVAVGSLIAGPLLVAGGKASTNVFTPNEIRRYGGFAPYVKVCEAFPANDRPAKRGHGFPAGHASGGFALMSLAGLAGASRGRLALLATGVVAGSAMGIYQMAKGAHYLSHTIVSALCCWIVFLLLRRLSRGWQDDGAPQQARLPIAAVPPHPRYESPATQNFHQS